MKKTFLYLLLLPALASSAQTSSYRDSAEAAVFKKNNVDVQGEYMIDKKTKKKTLKALREFDANGYLTKLVWPDATMEETFGFNEWQYDDKGKLINYKEGKIDKDSSQSIAFSESFNYNVAGLISRYRKEVYENEFSTLSTKYEYEYSDKGEKKEITYSSLSVRKDSICNDEMKYTGGGMPLERTIHNYYPKGMSDLTKYSASGLPMDYMRYEKGKVVSHKIYSYAFDRGGVLVEETIIDGIAKTSEKRKYEKDKISFTKMNSKGKILNSSSLSYSAPKIVAFPPVPNLSTPALQKNETAKNTTKKEKLDKKKNKVVESFVSGKLTSTETYNAKGLLIENNPAEENFFLQYEYSFY